MVRSGLNQVLFELKLNSVLKSNENSILEPKTSADTLDRNLTRKFSSQYNKKCNNVTFFSLSESPFMLLFTKQLTAEVPLWSTCNDHRTS